MNKKIYRKLAFQNIKKNKSTFFPFMLSAVTMAALFYMLFSVKEQTTEATFAGMATMQTILDFGVWICGILSAGILFYTNSFLMKRRTKELGLYNVLGLEKKHIGHVLFWEIMVTGILATLLGLLGGMIFSKLMFLILVNMIGLSVKIHFSVSLTAILVTLLLFFSVYLVIILYNHIRLYFLNPVDMLRQASAGEREPKAKVINAVIGVVCLAMGYYLAVTVENPLQSLSRFFVAVLLVIAGTYELFLTGSVVLLKLLKKNKGYYYHKTHFITVSSMIYRMKQNAVGLANICIFSTAVLIILSSTISLYVGIDNVLRTRYPMDVITDYLVEDGWENRTAQEEKISETVKKLAKKENVKVEDLLSYYAYGNLGVWKGSDIVLNESNNIQMDSLISVEFRTLEDYRRNFDKDAQPEEGKTLVVSSENRSFQDNKIKVFGKEYEVQLARNPKIQKQSTDNLTETLLFVLPDFETLKKSSQELEKDFGNGVKLLQYNYSFNLKGEDQAKIAFSNQLRDELNQAGVEHTARVENIFTNREEFMGIYASLFFIGIFIGTLFLTATVLIIYYKQISEGFEDQKRFDIMKKVGMDKKEVKHIINNQIRTVFYLPIAAAVVHILFAFKLVKGLLKTMNLTNVPLYILCTAVTVIVFVLFYTLVYRLTARTYYRLVDERK